MVPGPTAIRDSPTCVTTATASAPCGSLSRLVLGLDPAWAAALPEHVRGSGSASWSGGRGALESRGPGRTLCPQQEQALLWKGDGAGWILCPG